MAEGRSAGPQGWHVIGSRQRSLPAPPSVVWRSLVDPHQPGARPWLVLLADEVEPEVRESVEPELVVWSSLWPRRPDDVVRLELRVAGADTSLRWTMTTPAAPPATCGTDSTTSSGPTCGCPTGSDVGVSSCRHGAARAGRVTCCAAASVADLGDGAQHRRQRRLPDTGARCVDDDREKALPR